MLELYFPRNHIHSSIFNRSKTKVSFSCMQNIKSVINNHDMKVLNNTTEIGEIWKCRSKNNYPLDGKDLFFHLPGYLLGQKHNLLQKYWILKIKFTKFSMKTVSQHFEKLQIISMLFTCNWLKKKEIFSRICCNYNFGIN